MNKNEFPTLEDVPIKPNEKHILRISESKRKGFESSLNELNIPKSSIKKIYIKIEMASYGDGTGFRIGGVPFDYRVSGYNFFQRDGPLARLKISYNSSPVSKRVASFLKSKSSKTHHSVPFTEFCGPPGSSSSCIKYVHIIELCPTQTNSCAFRQYYQLATSTTQNTLCIGWIDQGFMTCTIGDYLGSQKELLTRIMYYDIASTLLYIEPSKYSFLFAGLKGDFMQRFKGKVSITSLLVGFGVCIFLFNSSIKSNSTPRQINPSVRSAVSKLEILETKMLGPHVLQVVMRNGYSKDITAVVASIGGEKVARRDYIFAEMKQAQKLSPGATDEFLYTIDSIEEENIVIKAVLFSDMTREGDAREVKDVLGKRLGYKIQLNRFNSYLEKLNKIDNTRLQTEFQKVRRVAENLPIKLDGDYPMSDSLESGLKNGREFILRYLSKLNDQLRSENIPALSNNEQPVGGRYAKFRDYSLRVETDFTSLASRL